MKKKIVLAVTIVAALATLVGCGNNEDATIVNEAGEVVEAEAEVEEDIDANDYVVAGDYSDITVAIAPKKEVTEEELDANLESILQSNTSYELITDRPAEDGDLVEITYVGTVDGEEFDSGTIGEDGADFMLGSGTTIDGFEDAIVGMNVGEETIAPMTFPEDYAATDLAGKDAEFDITLVAIKKLIVPEELTEEMIKAANPDCTTEEELREAIRIDLEESYAETYKETVEYEAFTVLLEASTFEEELPESMIEKYEALVISEQEQWAGMYGVDLETLVTSYYQQTMEEFNTDMHEQAVEYTKHDLLMQVLIEQEGIEITDADITAFAEENFEVYGYESAEVFIETVGEVNFEDALKTEAMFEVLLENTTVEDLVEESVEE